MPQKHIYIREEDLPLFERAQALAGEESLSSVITEALRRYIAAKETFQEGFEEVVIKEGLSGEYRTLKFYGKKLASQTIYSNCETSNLNDRGYDVTVYLTKKGKLLVHAHRWSRWQGEKGYQEYRVFNSLEELHGTIRDDSIPFANLVVPFPPSLLQEVEKALGEEGVVYLDV